MTHFACIAIGMADCTPNSQTYIEAATALELATLVSDACHEWDEEEEQSGYCYSFRNPGEGESNYSQRLRIARDRDWVLDVIGMTEADFRHESEGE